jgi:P27 family predicted phage terminase small subunit
MNAKHLSWLSPIALQHYKRLSEQLDTTAGQSELLALLCHYLAKHQELVEMLEEEGDVLHQDNGTVKAHPAAYLKKNTVDSIIKLSTKLGIERSEVVEDLELKL